MNPLAPAMPPNAAPDDGGTMVYTVDLGDGRAADIEGPKGATPEQLQAAASASGLLKPSPAADAPQDGEVVPEEDQHAALSRMTPEDEATALGFIEKGDSAGAVKFAASKGFDFTNADQLVDAHKQTGQINKNAIYKLAPLPEGGAGASFARGVADYPTAGLLDEAGALVDTLGGTGARGNVWNSDQGFSDLYKHNLDLNRGILQGDEADHPVARMAGQLLGGLAIPAGLEGVGYKAGSAALREGATMQEARAIAATAVRNRMMQVGGATGAAHGFGAADGNVGDRLLGAGEEGALGAAGGFVLGKAGETLAPRFAAKAAAARAAPMTEAEQVAAAAGRQGLDILPADVGGPVTRGMTAATAQTPLGVVPIAKAAQRLDQQAEERVGAVSREMGVPAADNEGVGTISTEGALKYASAAKRAGGRLYDAAAVKAGDSTIELKNARDVLDQQIARLEAVPGGGAGLKEARELRAALDKPYPVQGVRDMRTENFVSPDFRGTPVEARMKAVTNAAADDIVEGLRAQGKGEAADMFRAADEHWRTTLVNLKRNVEPIIGKLDNLKSPEAVASALNSAMKNNGARVGAFVNSLPEEQQGVVRASLLAPLGRDKDGVFSIARFATDWNTLSPAAKRAVFGAESRAALDDLALVGGGAKQAAKYANHSNTARAVIADRMLGTLGTGATIGVSLNTFGAALAGQYGMGRLLASPRFARWLARGPKTALSGPAYIDRLSRIARAEPAIANEVLGLQQRLSSAFASVPQRAAADDKTGKE